MTITVSITIPEGWKEQSGEVKQWVRDLTTHNPRHYVVTSDEISRPEASIERDDGTSGVYYLSEGGNWEVGSAPEKELDDSREV